MFFLFPLYILIGAIIGIFILNRKTVSEMNLEAEETSPFADKKTKIMLTVYFLLSSFLFAYLCLTENSGLGITLFAFLQFIFITIYTKKMKSFFFLLMSFLISLSYLISTSEVWKGINIPVMLLLVVLAVSTVSFYDSTFDIILKTLKNAIRPLGFVTLPFRWLKEINSGKAGLVKRVLLALVITVPASLILVFMLSGADMVFSAAAESFREYLSELFDKNVLTRGITGILAGLYSFGILCLKYFPSGLRQKEAKERKGDLLIINIFLCTLLTIYTLFIFIQFRYLFSGSALPYGLSYTEYARQGFFELLALSVINVLIIVITVSLTKSYEKKKFTLGLCLYLCTVTLIMLASSFYRMKLYSDFDGLTRLRLYVFIFLVFEAAGLIFTFIYILKPRFNPIAVYMLICLVYYTSINLIPVDYIIAETQVNRYITGKREDIDYVFYLSPDAAPALEKLYSFTDSPELKERIKDCFKYRWDIEDGIPERWQRFNISGNKAEKIYNTIK